jgi:hypothetical protein
MTLGSRIKQFKPRSRRFFVLPLALISSGLLASVCMDTEYFRPLTNGDGIRYPLTLSPAFWDLLGPVIPVKATDGLIHLAYDIELSVRSPYPITSTSFEVIDPDNNNQVTGTNQIFTIANTNVTGKIEPFNNPAPLSDSTYVSTLNGGETGAIYFDVTYPNRQSVPAHISHQSTVNGTAGDPPAAGSFYAIDEPIYVSDRAPVVLSPPLRGKGWLVANACCRWISPHRGGLEPVNAQVRAPEMFAIDFEQLNDKGLTFTGSETELSSYAYYGDDIYSSAAGKVVEVVRDLPDGTPGSDPAHPTAATASGNHVIVDIGEGRYIMYAHMIPGSPTVAVGDVIPEGMVIGKLGDSGNASAPHLHFQVMDRPSSLGAHGLPFVFDHMYREATYPGTLATELNDIQVGIPLQLDYSTARSFHDTMPLTLDVLNFGK